MSANVVLAPGEELLPLQGEELLDRAELLVSQIGEHFYELGQRLYEVKVAETYKLRGFGSLAEWANDRLGFKKRKAEHYIQIWEKLNQKLGFEWAQVKHIGWSRLSRVVPVIETRTDAKKWLKLAEKHSKRELETLVKEHRDEKRAAQIESGEILPGRGFDHIHHDTDDELADIGDGGGPFVDPAILQHAEVFEEDPETGESQPLHEFKVYLYPEQWSNVMDAMERAGQLTGSNKACNLLDMMATEFNGTYVETADGGVAHGLERHVKLLERVFGVKLSVEVPRDSKLRQMSRLSPPGDQPAGTAAKGRW